MQQLAHRSPDANAFVVTLVEVAVDTGLEGIKLIVEGAAPAG